MVNNETVKKRTGEVSSSDSSDREERGRKGRKTYHKTKIIDDSWDADDSDTTSSLSDDDETKLVSFDEEKYKKKVINPVWQILHVCIWRYCIFRPIARYWQKKLTMKALQYNTDSQYKWPVKETIDDLDIEQIVAGPIRLGFNESPPITVMGVPFALKNYLAYRRRSQN